MSGIVSLQIEIISVCTSVNNIVDNKFAVILSFEVQIRSININSFRDFISVTCLNIVSAKFGGSVVCKYSQISVCINSAALNSSGISFCIVIMKAHILNCTDTARIIYSSAFCSGCIALSIVTRKFAVLNSGNRTGRAVVNSTAGSHIGICTYCIVTDKITGYITDRRQITYSTTVSTICIRFYIV